MPSRSPTSRFVAAVLLLTLASCRQGPPASSPQEDRPTAVSLILAGFPPPTALPRDLENVKPVGALVDHSIGQCVDGDDMTDADDPRIKFRLIGIDAVELGEWGYYEARDRLRTLVQGKRVQLEVGDTAQDDESRGLVYAWLRDASGDLIMVNQILVREGYARAYAREDNLRYADILQKEQAKARRDRARIWSVPIPGSESYVSTTSGRGRCFHRPECADARKIRSENRQTYRSRDEAIDDGLTPCRNCRP